MFIVMRGVIRLIRPLVSLALCAAAVALCLRSDDAPLEYSWPARGGRTTVRLARHCGLYTTPHVPRASQGTTSRAAEVPPLLINSQIDWDVSRNMGQTTGVSFDSFEWARWRLRGGRNVPLTDIARPLLDGLESPDSFVAAHLALSIRNGSDAPVTLRDQPDGSCYVTIDGLTLKLRARDLQESEVGYAYGTATMEVDPAQLKPIRAIWHRRLDAKVVVFPLWPIAIVTFAYALVSFFRTFRRWTRSWRGCCAECGYLLYGNTTGICSECGSPFPAKVAMSR